MFNEARKLAGKAFKAFKGKKISEKRLKFDDMSGTIFEEAWTLGENADCVIEIDSR